MKKTYLLIMAFLAIWGGLAAQVTDVTATYLTNAGFDTNCNFKAADAAANLGSANGGANVKVVEGWTKGQIGDNSAAATFEYGYAGSLNLSGTTGFIPAQGPGSVPSVGALGISAAWSATITYYQEITLPVGEYYIEYTTYNSGPNAADNSLVGWVPNSGTSVISNKTSFALNVWETTQTANFKVTAPTVGKVQVGISSPNSGSASVGRIFFDNVKIFRKDVVDKTGLEALLSQANTMKANPQPVGTSTVYADLDAAITAAQAVYDNASATLAQVVEQEAALNAAISKVNSAILIQQRASTWTTLPYDITSLIVNPSFETATANNQSTFNGWTNVGPLVSQNNTSFPFKAGNYYIEKWKSSGNWTGLKISQKIIDLPNGIYKLTAGALNEPNTTGGAFVFANDVKAEVFAPNDYTVTVTVTNNQLEIGYEVVNGGNYVATDNFRLSYISDGSPYLVLAPESLFFDALNLTKTFTVSGGNLTANATLTAPAGITLDKTSLTPAEVAAGATVTATYDNATAIMNAKITVTSGAVIQEVNVIGSADATCFIPMGSPNLIPNPYLNSLAPFAGWGLKSIVYGAEAYCGAAAVKFEATTNTWPDGAALDVNGIAWEANSTYRVRAMVKSVDGTFAFYAKGANPDVTISIAQSNDEWVLIDQTFTTGAAPTTNFFSFNNVDGGSTGKVAYIDNWELFKVGTTTSVSSLRSSSKLNAFVQNGLVVANFDANAVGIAELAIYNIQGVELAKVSTNVAKGQNQYTFNAELPVGVYVIRMSENNITTTVKVVK
ncbi:MAG: T9SS type A sorting domain-containing protein [Paludibacter sp.]|jgi:hypothetical protein|nr:T9SS type A sorting domain-containing protein [Paludibacter sp.]